MRFSTQNQITHEYYHLQSIILYELKNELRFQNWFILASFLLYSQQFLLVQASSVMFDVFPDESAHKIETMPIAGL